MRPYRENHVELTGIVQFDPEIREIAPGRKVARFSLRTTEHHADEHGAEMTDTQYHAIVAWGEVADQVDRMLSKGSPIRLTGRIVTRDHTTKGGVRCITEIVMNEFRVFIPKAPCTS